MPTLDRFYECFVIHVFFHSNLPYFNINNMAINTSFFNKIGVIKSMIILHTLKEFRYMINFILLLPRSLKSQIIIMINYFILKSKSQYFIGNSKLKNYIIRQLIRSIKKITRHICFIDF